MPGIWLYDETCPNELLVWCGNAWLKSQFPVLQVYYRSAMATVPWGVGVKKNCLPVAIFAQGPVKGP